MKSEKTEKELAEAMVSAWGRFDLSPRSTGDFDNWRAAARVAAQALGVELAPERPALPGWAEEELRKEGRGVYASNNDRVYLNDNLTWGPDAIKADANRAAFVEIHRRWLAAKRRAERWVGPGVDNLSASQMVGCLLDILRGEDRA